VTFTVGDDVAVPVRLDAFLHRTLGGGSRRLVRGLIDAGDVRVNGRRAPKGASLRRGDRVTLPDVPDGVAPELEIALTVLHEDPDVVAVDKPGGMPSHALDPRECGTAVAFVVARWPETRAVGDRLAPGLVHRLDTGTSGVLVAARTAAAHAEIRQALRGRAVTKRYLAVVAGDASAIDGVTCRVPLGHDPRDRRRMAAVPAGIRRWEAETTVATVAAGAARSVVRATIRTGVTHQVRVHLAVLGHPVVGDVLYAGPRAALPPARHALHAEAITLPHPRAGTSITIEAPLPDDMRRLIG
jgi:23S rRNA pseudouridine1911/1915/1917 synthase